MVLRMSYTTIYDMVSATGVPNFLEARMPLSSGLNITAWRLLLSDYPDAGLLDHLEFAWPLDYTLGNVPTATYRITPFWQKLIFTF